MVIACYCHHGYLSYLSYIYIHIVPWPIFWLRAMQWIHWYYRTMKLGLISQAASLSAKQQNHFFRQLFDDRISWYRPICIVSTGCSVGVHNTTCKLLKRATCSEVGTVEQMLWNCWVDNFHHGLWCRSPAANLNWDPLWTHYGPLRTHYGPLRTTARAQLESCSVMTSGRWLRCTIAIQVM